ncbi:hypothetical protein RGQ29_022008 [Quercus rubra]|uniref:Uncharacterized protein n=1 Tax=Quercus rubra TaxID=3512 RepID=A0AAN7F2K3_QUERU|nr:hypothetical protein RGQ29_022008 [Quercus rubra]
MVGLDAMKHANSTLEDFCRSYFMFHGMDVNRPQSVFKYLPVLYFTGSFLYQRQEGHQRLITKFTDALQSNPFGPLMGLLEFHGLLTESYSSFESMKSVSSVLKQISKCIRSYILYYTFWISIEDVMRAIHLKSSDYRILNLLLYQLRGEKVNDLHMEFLLVAEFLVEDDVLKNSFNVLRMFVKIYGASRAPTMLGNYITEAEQKYDSLLKTLDPQLAFNYQKRRDEVIEEGGKIYGHDLRTWSIPNVIVDEEFYRFNFTDSK